MLARVCFSSLTGLFSVSFFAAHRLVHGRRRRVGCDAWIGSWQRCQGVCSLGSDQAGAGESSVCAVRGSDQLGRWIWLYGEGIEGLICTSKIVSGIAPIDAGGGVTASRCSLRACLQTGLDQIQGIANDDAGGTAEVAGPEVSGHWREAVSVRMLRAGRTEAWRIQSWRSPGGGPFAARGLEAALDCDSLTLLGLAATFWRASQPYGGVV